MKKYLFGRFLFNPTTNTDGGGAGGSGGNGGTGGSGGSGTGCPHPRPPYGGRPADSSGAYVAYAISIHALHAEGDSKNSQNS